ncbi:unnamed protein product [Allacma fusca]|uniref:Uncharacterized protein n=1 Tax=Allacma fusca TaxID=39272 RepID=A0A8J2JLJ8_9HEXA|nr:unnamed protein product [Allacma fusca]
MKIFARHFAILVNFVGTSKKIKFRDTKTHCLMIDAARHALSTEVTERQKNIAIQNWFRGSKDRYGGSNRPRVCEQENRQTETNLSATRYDSGSNTLQ